MADPATLIQLARGMRSNIFSAVDKEWLEWRFQLKTYMAVMSTTISTDINTTETMQTPITIVGVTERALAKFKTSLFQVCCWKPQRQLCVQYKKYFFTERVGNARNTSVIQNRMEHLMRLRWHLVDSNCCR